MPASTVPETVSSLVRKDAARPLLTFYDDATGERVELSVATFANWVAKTASLALDDLDVEPGTLALLDLPTHWLGAVWLAAAWTAGYPVTTDPADADRAGLVVCGPSSVAEHAPAADRVPVVALSLRPLGGRFAEPLPPGLTDFGAVVLAQPDAFVSLAPPEPGSPAWQERGEALSQQELLSEGGTDPAVDEGGRLLTDVNPCSRRGARLLASLLVRSAGTVLVANPDEASWPGRFAQERATAELRATRAG
ncbi:MAG TPA: TIGR03089 family protein [Nocardioidaceae bacterium]|nr:TIGR03089 family protein [Nocardioidaceae bacterium]